MKDGDLLPKFEGKIFAPRSWSPDGKWLAGGVVQPDGTTEGLVVFSLETQEYERIANSRNMGPQRPPSWLLDNRRLIFQDMNAVLLADRITKKTHPINLDAGTSELNHVRITNDNKKLYFVRVRVESDIWMMQMK